MCRDKHEKRDKKEPGLCKEELRCPEVLCLCSKTYCCQDETSDKFKFNSKVLNNRTLEQSDDGPQEKCRKVLDDSVKNTTNEVHTVAAYEQIKGAISSFYLPRIVESDGIHTQPLNL